uniref:N-acetyltransferase domain-containing protein n=1 Tax=uncultured Methanosarcinales archaeon TaxID=183757 RepID=A0A7H1KP28_9EURY|nr:hypothetical protein HAHEADPM_00026 [uncultured Methanosarcinales archaeon]
MAVRFCNIDYDREITIAAFVEEDGEGGEDGEDGETKMTGVGRLIIEPDEESAEFGVAVIDRWQGHGINPFIDQKLCKLLCERYIIALERMQLQHIVIPSPSTKS